MTMCANEKFSYRNEGQVGVAFLAINLRTKYLKVNKDGSKRLCRFLLSDIAKPPRHALTCFYRPSSVGSELYVFDPMTKTEADRSNPCGIFSYSIVKEVYERLNRPTIIVSHGKSRGSDCLWQALRHLDGITSSKVKLDEFLRQ